jgi:formylglycine-generating enzyme required for sulfatase activity
MDAIAWYYPNTAVTYETAFNCLNTETRLDCLDFPEDVFLGTHPVAQKLPNNWGLYDMTGNVWERVWDWQTTYPDPGTSVVDPTGPAIDQIGLERAMRGAPFNANGQYLRVAYRTGPPARSRAYNTGFRLVRSILP